MPTNSAANKNRVRRKEYRREDQCLSIEIEPYQNYIKAELDPNLDEGEGCELAVGKGEAGEGKIRCIVYTDSLCTKGTRAHAQKELIRPSNPDLDQSGVSE